MKNQYFIIGIFLVFALVLSSCQDSLVDDTNGSVALKSGKRGYDKVTGFDEWGFNWNAHCFSGNFYNAIMADHMFEWAPWWKWQGTPYNGNDKEITPPDPEPEEYDMFGYFLWDYAWELRNVQLSMHWSEALISNEGVYPDLNDWIDSNAWMTSHYSGDDNGERWSLYLKMVAAKSTDFLEEGLWYNKDGEQIGKRTDWDQLILIKVVKTGNIPEYLSYFGFPSSSYKGLVNAGLKATK